MKNYNNLSDEGKADLLDEVFGEFVDNVLDAAGIDPLQIPEPVYDQLLNQTYILYQMLKAPLDIQKNSRLRLHQLMGVDIDKLKDNLELYNKKLKDEQTVENMTGLVAERINGQIKTYMDEEAENLIKLLNEKLPYKKLSPSDQKWLAEVFENIATSEDPAIENLWNYTSDVLHASLMKIFIDVANKMPAAADPAVAKSQLIPQMIKQVADIMGIIWRGCKKKSSNLTPVLKMKKSENWNCVNCFPPLPMIFLNLPVPMLCQRCLSLKLLKPLWLMN